MLTDIRQGRVDDGDRMALASRLGLEPVAGEVAVHLSRSTGRADGLNDLRLAQIEDDEHGFYAESARSCQSGGPVEEEHARAGAPGIEDRGRRDGAAQRRRPPVRQRVIGTVRGFAPESKGGWPIVEFENGNIVTMKQASWEMMDGETVLASVKQVPLRCAWAITIHKSQGMTLDRL